MPTIKLQHPLDPIQISVFSDLVSEFDRIDIDYVVIGALARDIVLWHCHGIGAGRATRDTDTAILVSSWDEFKTVKTALVDSGRFTDPESPKRQPQRLIYIGSGGSYEMPVDLVPFGGIERADGKLVWPPDGDFVMPTTGHREVLADKLDVAITNDISLNVAPIRGITLLKLFAWHDRPDERQKDAHDLKVFILNYHQTGNEERLYGEDIDIFERFDFDVERAGAFLLGRDVAALASSDTRAALETLISDERMIELLTIHMLGAAPLDDALARPRSNLVEFIEGLMHDR
ncbi:MAG: hypothetical protein E2O35_05965 [Proteobacteria bacterium]|nr:MAG: hypothetical protein E2O35_05965 [Pseudomonadota bacterium]